MITDVQRSFKPGELLIFTEYVDPEEKQRCVKGKATLSNILKWMFHI